MILKTIKSVTLGFILFSAVSIAYSNQTSSALFIKQKMAKLKSFARRCSSSPTSTVLADKFKGCLVGSLIGDCYGKPYKLSDEVSKAQLQKYFEKLNGPYFKAPFKPYTSNIALSNCVALSLLNKGALDPTDISKRFVKEYFENPYRDYGGNVSKILMKLRGAKFIDPFAPAKEQFLGMGSYGNSAAARVPPITLFFYKHPQKMVKGVIEVSDITNSHQMGRNGAILQSWAIRLALDLNGDSPIDTDQYLINLLQKLEIHEIDEEELDLKDVHMFKQQLELVKKLLALDEPTEDRVVSTLGHAKVALYSVPTAIYCFLRSANDIPGVDTSSPFRRAVQYAIALGGDANTISSMAGAIAGACYGHININEQLQRHCEGLSSIVNIAENLSKSVVK